MAAQILAVIIFIVMFGLIIWDHIERHIVSLGCGLLTLVLVFGICMHSEAAAAETLSLHSFMVPNFWFQTEAAVLERHQLGDDSFYCRYDADGGGHGARGIFPVAVPDNRQGGTL